MRDLFCELSSLAWNNVVKEPTLQEPSSAQSTEGLVADLAVRSVWQHQCTSMFDVRIVDTDSPSYSSKSPLSVLITAENEKRGSTLMLVRPATVILPPLPLHRWPHGK